MSHEHRELSLNNMAIPLAILFSCAIATNLIGIFAIVGALPILLRAMRGTELEPMIEASGFLTGKSLS